MTVKRGFWNWANGVNLADPATMNKQEHANSLRGCLTVK